MRRTARLLSAAASISEPTLAQTALILRLAALVNEIADLRERQRRTAQAAAARHAAEELRAAACTFHPQHAAAEAQWVARRVSELPRAALVASIGPARARPSRARPAEGPALARPRSADATRPHPVSPELEPGQPVQVTPVRACAEGDPQCDRNS